MNDRGFLAKLFVLCAALAAMLAALDWLAGRVLDRAQIAAEIVDIQTPAILLAKLDFLRRFPGYKVAVCGDSVVYGHSLYEHGDMQWREHNLCPLLESRLRREMPERQVLVMNLGINGALPEDVRKVTSLLAACHVDLLLMDVGMRAFSSDFAAAADRWSRPWLADMSYDGDGRFALASGTASPAARMEQAPAEWLLNHSALYRARDLLQYRWFDGQPRQYVVKLREELNEKLGGKSPSGGGDADDDMILLMKAKMRFDGINFRGDNPQRQAFQQLLHEAPRSAPRTLLFYAKEDPARVDNLLEPPRYQQLMGEFSALVKPATGEKLIYMPPQAALQPQHDLDHSHLTYAGYQVLVEQLWTYLASTARR